MFDRVLLQVYLELWKNSRTSNNINYEGWIYWTLEATQVFEKILEAMCKAPILTTPNFTKTFILEFDILGNGIGAALM